MLNHQDPGVRYTDLEIQKAEDGRSKSGGLFLMPKTRLLPVLILLVFASLGVSQSLLADSLNAGSTTTSLTDFTSGAGSLKYVNSTNIGTELSDASLESAVFSGTGGNLYFMFQILNFSTLYFEELAVTDFTGFTPEDVGYITDPSSLQSNPFGNPELGANLYEVGRSADGSAVTFYGSSKSFDSTKYLASSFADSLVLVIKTDATKYDNNGTFSTQSFDPTGSFEPVPEPGTLTLLAAGLLGLALLGSLKRKSVCSSRASA